jgi:hypothetical protein
LWRRFINTLLLMLYALLPARRPRTPFAGLPAPGVAAPDPGGEPVSCAPRRLHEGLESYLDQKGELRVIFIDCRALAAPLVLFRLKRQGYSRCSVQAGARGLLLEARR